MRTAYLDELAENREQMQSRLAEERQSPPETDSDPVGRTPADPTDGRTPADPTTEGETGADSAPAR